MKKFCALLLPLALAGCGTLPEPFYGNPGPAAARLATPPAPVLMVPTPAKALLGGSSAALYAQDLATQLAADDVPSVAGPPMPGQWQLGISAVLQGDKVVPSYAAIGPDGKTYGTVPGTAIAAQDWANGSAMALTNEAAADATSLTKEMAVLNAQIQQSDPDSLENRPPRIFVGAVSGAMGDGDNSLPLNLGRDLPGPDLVVVTSATRADFTVTGKVSAKPDTNGQLQVELDWVVRDVNNRVTGQVTQIHDLNPVDIDPYWGDVAAAAASEAAGGIQTVVQNAILKKPAKPAAPPSAPPG